MFENLLIKSSIVLCLSFILATFLSNSINMTNKFFGTGLLLPYSLTIYISLLFYCQFRSTGNHFFTVKVFIFNLYSCYSILSFYPTLSHSWSKLEVKIKGGVYDKWNQVVHSVHIFDIPESSTSSLFWSWFDITTTILLLNYRNTLRLD